MQRFASKYLEDNPDGHFVSTDSVHLLSYAIIMLDTDRHSSLITNKITLNQWKKIIENEHQVFDGDMIENVFLRICDTKLLSNIYNGGSGDDVAFLKRIALDMDHNKVSMALQHQLFTTLRSAQFYSCNKDIQHLCVKSMFEECWAPLLAAFNYNMKHKGAITEECLMLGFKSAMNICCMIEMNTQFEAFGSSVSHRTNDTSTEEGSNASDNTPNLGSDPK
eukprot:TRINITY_DN229_c0_g3_i3.p1 TRINITY_DN229_c0_g3~~TRINITY_DN229_c0_g3_i3.p1  ORF type:complete len:221 (+),score=31.94 TRINITY_DN229_c0_g3_i3:203-865(+)